MLNIRFADPSVFVALSRKRRYCCNLSGGVALIVWFTTNGLCAKNKNICMWREQAIIVISSGDLYCCLLPRCEALRTCRSGFPIATVYLWKGIFFQVFHCKNVRRILVQKHGCYKNWNSWRHGYAGTRPFCSERRKTSHDTLWPSVECSELWNVLRGGMCADQ